MAARLLSLGRTLVPTPGTPVALTLPAALNPPSCHAWVIQALAVNTGNVYVGLVGLNRTTLENVLIVLPLPTTTMLPVFSASLAHAANALGLDALRFDADQANNGVLVSVIVA